MIDFTISAPMTSATMIPGRLTPVPVMLAPVAPANVCPLCHRVGATGTETDLAAGSEWRCGTCGQRGDAASLDPVVVLRDVYRVADVHVTP